ncbi:MAG: undecaprenyl/decaprenyl-phosphate alpha-N-acetylglucosaminyl 1-phosphate transferase [Chitinophagaceae bacterium]|jgi:UDP-N-acetylmuramyl pentapeptide phosphotransferase/UDP-N-acetylglucosamine-1-phosphate transferase|nr:undecaprenyl/decaprenyl-phosphate alpha-N-acetylglucosaminyl 1-phosphate transferase [Chitinophagaceae bacterium]
MLDIFLTGSVSFIITFLAIPVIIKIAKYKKLYDLPDERKVHTQPIPSLGGVGIFGGFLLAALLSIPIVHNPEFQYFFAAAFVIFFLGLKDDVLILTATKKFIGQAIAASILIHLGGIRIESMHGLLGIYEIPEAFSLALTYLTIIVITNSFNLIDGVDGLAGTLGLLTMVIFGVYFFMIDMHAYTLLSFSLAGSLVAFLIFNNNPAKIFMGDSGSLMVGLFNSILVIKFINFASLSTVSFPIVSAVAVGFAILFVPLFDTLRVFSIRIFSGRSPFTPDRNHFHHLLLDKGFSHTHVTLCCTAINIMFIALAYFGRHIGPNYIMLIMLLIAFTALGVMYFHRTRRKVIMSTYNLSKAIGSNEIKQTSKVIALKQEAVAVVNED